ncbi:hypothetical protein WOLCODRAFT_65482 [Wolfiporia cocos MD-104 SS10]|uniref:Cytochrome P450 n=1 Tax=Wolfiporia cocos (strain MD-104) TaxID=742152 RepID=A0A2H3JRA1_WOLCO|nr:hypothetical protein WOLCODRAFT_65482 [Wolfiporia cocos MD-104 SS10]
MSPYVSYAVIIFILCSLVYAQVYRASSTTKRINLSSSNEIRNLLDPPTPLAEQLTARATSNARLMRAFSIHSTFVHGDIDTHTTFTKAAVELISRHRLPWTLFADIASNVVDAHLHRLSSVAFDTFISRITLHVVIVGLLQLEPSFYKIDPDDLDVVAGNINRLWTMSKTTTEIPSHMLAEVNVRLHRWLPTYSNPIEFVIPVYETLWRVIAVTVALNHNRSDVRAVFAAFLSQPDSRRYHYIPDGDPSVEVVMQEVLRLYPPTRRISRTYTASDFNLKYLPSFLAQCMTRTITQVADIEALQRDSVWGVDVNDYDPMRHLPQRCGEAQRRTLLAFGAGKLTCVAKTWAPHAAAVIVATILDRVGDGDKTEFEVVAGGGIGGRSGWDGWRIQRVGRGEEIVG